MTPFQPWGWHYRVRAPKWLAAVSLLLLSLHATTSLGLVGLETADFLERADPDRFLINNLNNIGGEEGTPLPLYDDVDSPYNTPAVDDNPYLWIRMPTKRRNHGQLRFVKPGKRFAGHLRFVKQRRGDDDARVRKKWSTGSTSWGYGRK